MRNLIRQFYREIEKGKLRPVYVCIHYLFMYLLIYVYKNRNAIASLSFTGIALYNLCLFYLLDSLQNELNIRNLHSAYVENF